MCCCLPPCFYWLCFIPARAAHDWRAAVTRGDRAAAEDTGEARAATALVAMSTRPAGRGGA